jgi:hypothetical protein
MVPKGINPSFVDSYPIFFEIMGSYVTFVVDYEYIKNNFLTIFLIF